MVFTWCKSFRKSDCQVHLFTSLGRGAPVLDYGPVIVCITAALIQMHIAVRFQSNFLCNCTNIEG